MEKSQGSLWVRQQGRTTCFQVLGRATMVQGLRLRRLAEGCLAKGPALLRIHLSRCTYMDSTFLGTLLYLNRISNRPDHGEFAMVSPSLDCSRLMQQMGVAEVFAMVAEEDSSGDAWVEVTGDASDLDLCKQALVQAHKELAALDGPAGEPFRGVVRCLHELEGGNFPADKKKAPAT